MVKEGCYYTEAITEYSDTLVRRFIEKITDFDELMVVGSDLRLTSGDS